jgi:dTDP-4-dehydrorhamnose 3,5-epimerase
MRRYDTVIAGVQRVELDPWLDDRGPFVEALPSTAGFHVRQINLSKNEKAGTVRGMHWQTAPAAQTKLVYSVSGRFMDVAVDVRHDSPTYGKVVALELFPLVNALYIPPGVAHGCQALEDFATLMYLLDVPYSPTHERGMHVYDPVLAGVWPLTPVNVAPRDLNWPWMADLVKGAEQQLGPGPTERPCCVEAYARGHAVGRGQRIEKPHGEADVSEGPR